MKASCSEECYYYTMFQTILQALKRYFFIICMKCAKKVILTVTKTDIAIRL